jgi:hypothetical protein
MLGTGAMLPSSRTPLTPPPPVADDPEHGGGRGLGGAPAPSFDRPPESVALFLWGRSSACTDLAGRAARRLSQDTTVVDTGNVVYFDKPAAPERIRHTPLVAAEYNRQNRTDNPLEMGGEGATRRLGGSWGIEGATSWGLWRGGAFFLHSTIFPKR